MPKDLHKHNQSGYLISGRQDPLQADSFLFLHGVGMTLKRRKEDPVKKPPLGFIQPFGLTELHGIVSGFTTVQCGTW